MTTPKDDKVTTAGSSSTADGGIPGVAYAAAGDVRRMLNERANAVAYGQTDRIVGIDRDLKEAGFTGDPAAFAAGDKGPVGRSSGKPDVTAPVVTAPAAAPAAAPAPAAK